MLAGGRHIIGAMSPTLGQRITGTAVLPTYEADRAALAVKGRAIRPFDPATGFKARPKGSTPGRLPIDARLLMLAAAKTEFARSFDFAEAEEQAVGLWIRYKPLLILDGGPLRIAPRQLFARKDASMTFDSGRLGEGMGHLFMAQRSYVFWDHLPTLLAAVNHGRRITHAEQTRVAKILKAANVTDPDEQPDFVCETAAGDVALLECKGSFLAYGERYSADPSVLRKALSQLGAWAKLVSPTPPKSFAVGTFVREDGDTTNEPGMIAWADPPGEPGVDGALPPLPRDAIRRGHYGALLGLMGFVDGGRDLRLRVQRRPSPTLALTALIGKRSFVVSPVDYRSRWRPRAPGLWLGLDKGLFPAFASSLSDRNTSLEVQVIEPYEVHQEGIEGRVLADGSFVGEIQARALEVEDVHI